MSRRYKGSSRFSPRYCTYCGRVGHWTEYCRSKPCETCHVAGHDAIQHCEKCGKFGCSKYNHCEACGVVGCNSFRHCRTCGVVGHTTQSHHCRCGVIHPSGGHYCKTCGMQVANHIDADHECTKCTLLDHTTEEHDGKYVLNVKCEMCESVLGVIDISPSEAEYDDAIKVVSYCGECISIVNKKLGKYGALRSQIAGDTDREDPERRVASDLDSD